MLLGHAIVYVSLAVIFVDGLGFPVFHDGVIWLTVVLTIVARRVDITRFQGTTGSGEPATLAHWRRYSAIVVLVTAVASVGAHMTAKLGQFW